jgi:hypothetical protein
MYLTCNPYFVKQNRVTLFVSVPVPIITFDLWAINGRSFKQNFSIGYQIRTVKLTVSNNINMADMGSSEV